MKELEIFKYGICFQNWGELYSGCKAMWITPQDVITFCENKKIKQANDEDYISLYLALDDSYFQFLEQLKKLILKNNCVAIEKNEDEISDCVFDYIPSIYFKIWELEFLLEIISLPICVNDKLTEIALLFDKMNYPEEWKIFLFYQKQDGNILDNNSLYQNLINYVEEKIEKFKY